VDLFGRYPDQATNVSVAMTLDVERYWDLVLASLDRLGAAS
jgi:purine nucleosidase/pyrimidine-specific ribonucleoside hydrolase